MLCCFLLFGGGGGLQMTEAVTGAVLTIMKSRDEIDLHMASASSPCCVVARNPLFCAHMCSASFSVRGIKDTLCATVSRVRKPPHYQVIRYIGKTTCERTFIAKAC